MSSNRLKDFVKGLPSLKLVKGPFSSDSEVSKLIFNNMNTPIWIDEPFGEKNTLVSNIFSSKQILSYALKCSEKDLLDTFSKAIKETLAERSKLHIKKQNVKNNFLEINELNRKIMPFFQYFEGDKGPYITSSIVIAKNDELDYINASIHRLLVVNKKNLVIRMVEGRHLHKIYEKNRRDGKDTEVAILIGTSPSLLLSAATTLPLGVSELVLASKLKSAEIEVTEDITENFIVPTETEYIILAEISKDEFAEERMADILLTYDALRKQPVVKIKRIYIRDDSIYHAILPGGLEHKLLMGFPRMAAIKHALTEKGIKVRDVTLTPGSGGWLHAVVSIEKINESDGKETIITILNEHRSVKGVIVVDDDIDVSSYEDIDFAIATRLKGRNQIVWIDGLRGSTLDPSANQVDQTTIKWGLDLTLKDIDKTKYKKARIN
ncbi:MAG: UbiD family decarboxylase [Thermoproteota archaeon]|nr:UbiD family decarboxylase [Candidatus Brockarchaeota archaeon]MBO3768007.1 UbiD family decarboxylase [Candidatus Brockarchaeota archaeon]MBO3801685.1 UbiD family decarboxylase [Candidatus Brockarchaeota archaeon]